MLSTAFLNMLPTGSSSVRQMFELNHNELRKNRFQAAMNFSAGQRKNELEYTLYIHPNVMNELVRKENYSTSHDVNRQQPAKFRRK